MAATRGWVFLVVLALSSAALVGYVSRTPGELRRAGPSPGALDADRGAAFSDADVARHAAYRGPSYLAFALSLLIEIALLIVLARGPFAAVHDIVRGLPGGWAAHAFLLGAFIAVAATLLLTPLAFVRGFVIDHAWGLSTQDLAGWSVDRIKSALVGAVVAGVSAVAFFGVVRWQPRSWWFFGWIGFSLLTALFAFVWPVVIAPLFNRFTPLDDGSLRRQALHLARSADVDVDEVLVADASRRTTAENAYVAGLGGTKQLVVYDTLLNAGREDETLFVIAHELGHEKERHVWKFVLLSSVGLAIGFAALAWLSRTGIWTASGADGIGDLRALPLLLLFAAVAGLISLPLQSTISRRFEARADEVAIELTGDPEPAVRAFRRLAFSNIADLRPPRPVVTLLYTHPPMSERIRAIQRTATSASTGAPASVAP